MSIQFMDNFQIYGTDEAVMRAGTPWSDTASGFLTTDPAAGITTNVFRVIDQVSNQLTCVLPTSTNRVHVANRWWFDTFPSNDNQGGAYYFTTPAGNIRYVLHLTPTGAWKLRNTATAGDRIDSGDEGTVVFTSGNVMTTAAWQHVEFHIDFTTGEYELFVEGLSIVSGTDASPPGGSIICGIVAIRDHFFAGETTRVTTYIKDVVFGDDNGSVNNGQIGSVQVITITPDGDVSGDWTRSTGTVGYSLVDELSPNSDDYISAVDDPLPDEQIFSLSNLPPDVVSVRALQPMVRMNKTDGGDATIVLSLKSADEQDDSGTYFPLTSQSYNWYISELDPNTDSVWTPIAVDAANLGIDRTL